MPDGEINLEFPDQPESQLLCALQFAIDSIEDVSPYELSEVPQNLWASLSSDTGKIKSAEPIKIHSTKPLPKLIQYPLISELHKDSSPLLNL